MQIHSVGIDLGKTTFHLVALGAAGSSCSLSIFLWREVPIQPRLWLQRVAERDIIQMLSVPSWSTIAIRPPAADQPPCR